MQRRDFITLLGGAAAAWPLTTFAQKRPATIGFLGTGAADTSAIFVDALNEGLHENGLQEGRDYVLNFGWAEGNYERFPALAAQMVKSNVSVILATTISAVQAAQRATTTVPIVMTSINDPNELEARRLYGGNESRRVLREMNDKADSAADEQVARSRPMAPIRPQPIVLGSRS